MTILQEIIVVKTGTANLASVLAGLKRVGANPRLSDDPQEVAKATQVVLPGVGAFAAAMTQLRERGLTQVLIERIQARKSTLAICLGLQIFCQESEENPGISGLGVIPERVKRFQVGKLRVPQLGWNQIKPDPNCRYLKEGHAYFANSFHLEKIPQGYQGALADYGGSFVAAIESDGVLACQFHPELSGKWGLELLGRWVKDSVC